MRAARVLPGWSRNAAEPAAGTNPAAASADIDENGLVCVGGLGRFMCCCSRRHRSTSGLLSCTNRIHRVLHVQGGADDLTRLLIAALTASAHANRAVAAKAAALLAMRWQQPELLLLVSGCSGHVERNRPRADAAGFCTYWAELHLALSPSSSATRALLGRLVLKTDERSSGSIEGEADAGGAAVSDIAAAAACCHTPIACAACCTCKQELMT